MSRKSHFFLGALLASQFLIFNKSHAQVDLYKRSLLELKFGAGASFFLGDLGGGRGHGKLGFFDLDLATLRQNTSLGVKFNLSNKLSVRGDVFRARFYGSDALSGNRSRFERNLSFRADLTEISLTTELATFNLASLGRHKSNTSEFFVFAGLGWIHFNPQAQYQGKWHDLQPLGTEGQGLLPGKEFYRLNSIVIPFGFGYRKNIARRLYLGIELSMRKTFTDYIDDISGDYADKELIRAERGDVAAELSDRRMDDPPEGVVQRGNKNRNDNYSFVQITLAHGFGQRAAKQRIKIFALKPLSGRRLKCPAFH